MRQSESIHDGQVHWFIVVGSLCWRTAGRLAFILEHPDRPVDMHDPLSIDEAETWGLAFVEALTDGQTAIRLSRHIIQTEQAAREASAELFRHMNDQNALVVWRSVDS